MKKKLECILLLDDNKATNYIHRKYIEKADCTEKVLDFQNGYDALEYIKDNPDMQPDLVFVDINMPMMDAWEFLEEFKKIDIEQRKKSKLVMLTTSLSPIDIEKAKEIDIIETVMIKPLTPKVIHQIIHQLFTKSDEHQFL